MADELRLVRDESGVAEHVIEMRVRVDDVADGPRGRRGDGLAQRGAGRAAAAGVDHGDAALADHEADVRDVAARGILDAGVSAVMHVHAGRDFDDGERRRPARRHGAREDEE